MIRATLAEDLLYLAASRLGHLRDRVVFVGGAVRGLLITDPAVEGPRPTKDVDVILEVTPRSAYYRLEEELRGLGFNNDTREGAPHCRFVHGELTLDVMPADAATLGFSNRWYPHAIHTAHKREISVAGQPGLLIRIVSAPCFVATKLESYANRGGGDPYHHDLEDIIALVDGRSSLLGELERDTEEIRSFVSVELAKLFASGLESHIPEHLPGDAASQARFPLVLAALRRMERCPVLVALGEEFRSDTGGGPGATQAEGPWTYLVHGADAGVSVPRHRAKGAFVAVSARLTCHGKIAGTAGDGRNVVIEDGYGVRHPPNYSATIALRDQRKVAGPYDTIWPDDPFETLWVYDLPPTRPPYRLVLPSTKAELPLDLFSP